MTTADGGNQAPRTALRPRDTFAWRYPVTAVVCLLALPIGDPILFITAAVLAVFLLMAAVALIRGSFKRAFALVLGPVMFVSLYVFDIGWVLGIPYDLIRYYYHRDEYAARINALPPAERASRAVFFDWGSQGLAVTASSYDWLVYDESRQIALSDAERAQAWKDKVYAERSELIDPQCRTAAHRLIGHYYTMNASCTY